MTEPSGAAGEKVAVLVVDDQAEGLLAAQTVLEPLGEEIVTALSGQEALRHLLTRDFAMILMDVQMPVLDGYETATLIRERERSRTIPIIFVTAGMRSDEAVFRGYEVGAVDYVFKPVIPHILRSKVRVFADLARKETALRRQAWELAALNREREVQNRDLAGLNKELEAFSATASHDLRAPLRHISGFARMLGEHLGTGLDAEGKKYLDTISIAVDRMSALIEDLLNFSRLGRQEMRSVRVDLARLVEETRKELESASPDRNVEWRVGDLPEIRGDPSLLRVLFSNLLGNAYKYTRKRDKAVIEVRTELSVAEDVIVVVRDNGAGFDMERVGRLFNAFQRLHSAKEFEGTGMGLAIASRIVERHGGTIWAEGAVDAGATFRIQLPVQAGRVEGENRGELGEVYRATG